MSFIAVIEWRYIGLEFAFYYALIEPKRGFTLNDTDFSTAICKQGCAVEFAIKICEQSTSVPDFKIRKLSLARGESCHVV